MISVGTDVATNISPTDKAELVIRKTRMPAARSVNAVPTVETSWADQSSRKSRLRKTEKVDGRGPAGAWSSGGALGAVLSVSASVTDPSLSRRTGRRAPD